MSAQPASLWSASGTWRGIVLLTGACLALGLLGAPWRGKPSAPPPSAAYTPAQQPAGQGASTSGSATSAGGTSPSAGSSGPASLAGITASQAGDADRIEAANQPVAALVPAAPTSPPPSAQPPRSFLGVVWSEGDRRMPGPGISGGGLILGWGGWGGRSVAYANRGVTSGKHYWELTFSAQPGDTVAQTWTSAGMMGLTPAPEMTALMRIGERGSLVVEVGRDKSVRTGDVVMFALDADNRLGYWGVNGQWRNGVPGQAGGVPLKLGSGEQFVATGSVSAPKSGNPEGDRWIANFGATAFRYPVPPGFGPYGTGRGVAPSVAAAPLVVATAGGVQAVQSPATRASPDSLLGKVMDGTVVVAGEPIPLPEGAWTVLAHFKGNRFQPGDAVLLAQVKGKAVRRMVAVHAARGARPAGGTTFRSCLRQDVFFQSNDAQRMDAPRCWWVNHATGAWDEQALFKAARLELDQRGIQAASVFLNVGFHRSDAEGFATAFYYFDPAEEGIQSQPYLWSQSEWHKSRIESDPSRAAYARKLVEWGRSWGPVYFASR